jgi:Fe-S-cluster containining protein
MKNHKCKRCGKCCHSPRLFSKDIERINKAGIKDFIYTDNFKNNYIKDKYGWCMFLNKGKTAECKIYKARPKICRQYPSELRDKNCQPIELAFDKYLEKINSKPVLQYP